MAAKAASISLLREVADAVERLGEARVRTLLKEAASSGSSNRQGSLGLASAKKLSGVSRVPFVRQSLVEQIAQHLRIAESREDGISKIESAGLSRRELEVLARQFDVPVRKDQKVGDLQQLIVNVTVGGRLNSVAIRKGS